MPRVFIVNQPTERRAPAGTRAYDVTPAQQFGEPVFVFESHEITPCQDPAWATSKAQQVLADVTPEDYLVWAGGDPLGLIIASSIIADKNDGAVNYLKWERFESDYTPQQLSLYGE